MFQLLALENADNSYNASCHPEAPEAFVESFLGQEPDDLDSNTVSATGNELYKHGKI